MLARDGRRCQIKLPGCTLIATECDHIVRPEEGGAQYDPANLQAVCKPCNVAKRNRELAVEPPAVNVPETKPKHGGGWSRDWTGHGLGRPEMTFEEIMAASAKPDIAHGIRCSMEANSSPRGGSCDLPGPAVVPTEKRRREEAPLGRAVTGLLPLSRAES